MTMTLFRFIKKNNKKYFNIIIILLYFMPLRAKN